MLNDYYFFSETIADVNEDAGYVCEAYAFVLDGATGLSKKHVTSAGSDAAWYTDAMSRYLKENLYDCTKSIRDIIYDGIKNLSSKFYDISTAKRDPIDIPSAVGCISRINKDKLEYLVYGDCTLLIKNKNGMVDEIYDSKLVELDDYALGRCKEYALQHNMNFKDSLPFIRDIIKGNRLKMNTSEGYYNLSFYEKAAYEGGIYGHVDIKEIEAISLMSDGFADSYTLMRIADSPSEFMDMLFSKGPEFIYKKLVELQQKDSNLDDFPRFKLSDDSTCIIARL